MNYLENKNIFYNSDYVLKIIDNWNSGIPFFMKIDGVIYDAFLFYSYNVKRSQYYSIKMLVIVNTYTGQMEELTNQLDIYDLSNNFLFKAKSDLDIEKYLSLCETLQEIYIKLRDNYILYGSFDKVLKDRYLNVVIRLIPDEIINKVYSHLSPDLFNDY